MHFLAALLLALPVFARASHSELSNIMSAVMTNVDSIYGRIQFQITLNAMYSGLVQNVPFDTALIPSVGAGPGSFSQFNGTLQQTLWQVDTEVFAP